MPKFANKLDRLLADVVLANKFARRIELDAVRKYIRTIPKERLVKEISEITSEPELKQLAGAGVPGFAQDTFLAVISKVTRHKVLS